MEGDTAETNKENSDNTTKPLILSTLSKRKKLLIGLFSVGIISLILVIIGSYWHIRTFEKYVLDQSTTDKIADVGIVFGSGITDDGKPFQELQARLDEAAKRLEDGLINTLILSGDNRFESYDEPTAMLNYLVVRGVDESKLQLDFAGRSTYETCERAKKIFGVDRAILFSANSHLPRAIFICRSFGIESYGIGNTVEANNAGRRELLARVKAMFNVYIYGEKTILGNQINL